MALLHFSRTLLAVCMLTLPLRGSSQPTFCAVCDTAAAQYGANAEKCYKVDACDAPTPTAHHTQPSLF